MFVKFRRFHAMLFARKTKMHLMCLTIMLLGQMGVTVFAQGNQKKTDQKTLIVPEVTYRQAYLVKRKDSSYLDQTYTNYADQIYLSLKMVRTFDFVNEVVVEPAIRTKRNLPGSVEAAIDQGYMRVERGDFNLLAGKRTEYSGSGFLLNPSDLLNESKDIYDPLYQREGRAMTRVQWMDGDSAFGVGFIPQQKSDVEFGKLWLSASTQIWSTDLKSQYTYNRYDRSTIGGSIARFFGEHFELHLDGRSQEKMRSENIQPERVVFNCDAINAVNSATQTGGADQEELTCLSSSQNENSWTHYVLVGSRIVMTSKRTLVVENIQNQTGLTPDEYSMYLKYVHRKINTQNDSIEPPKRLIGRQYGFFAYQDEDTLRSTLLSVSLLYNILDRSQSFSSEVRYTFNPIINASIMYNQLTGDVDSEFGGMPFAQSTYLVVRGRF